jgi:hypothetical protein
MDIQGVTPVSPSCRIALLRVSRDEADHMEKLTWGGFMLRFVAACALVLVTFNPSGHSFLHWVSAAFPHLVPLQAVAGIVLLIGWVIYLRATLRSLGAIGVLLVFAFLAALIWLLVSWGWIDIHTGSALTWVALMLVALVLAAGISWSSLRRRLTGQADVDEVSR